MYKNQVRIIGGKYRGRKLRFPTISGLRPTSDRMKETLFNWLIPVIQGASCLDLFAGSGAMGFEALSRGAAHVIFVDQNPSVIDYLKTTQTILQSDNMEILCLNAIDYLKKPDQTFDIIFVDPPFQADLIMPCCQLIMERHLLNPGGYIYVEANAHDPLSFPDASSITKQKQAGQVKYYLLSIRRET